MPIELFVQVDENGRSPAYEAARAACLDSGLEIADEQRIGDPVGGGQILMVSGFVVLVSRKRFADLRSACQVTLICLGQLAQQLAALQASPAVASARLDVFLEGGRPPDWRYDNPPELPARLRELAAELGVGVSVFSATGEWIARWPRG